MSAMSHRPSVPETVSIREGTPFALMIHCSRMIDIWGVTSRILMCLTKLQKIMSVILLQMAISAKLYVTYTYTILLNLCLLLNSCFLQEMLLTY